MKIIYINKNDLRFFKNLSYSSENLKFNDKNVTYPR